MISNMALHFILNLLHMVLDYILTFTLDFSAHLWAIWDLALEIFAGFG